MLFERPGHELRESSEEARGRGRLKKEQCDVDTLKHCDSDAKKGRGNSKQLQIKVALLSIFLSLQVLAAGPCAELLELDGTSNAMAYMDELLETQVMGDAELVRFIDGLKGGEAVNPFGPTESTDALIHRDGLQSLMEREALRSREAARLGGKKVAGEGGSSTEKVCGQKRNGGRLPKDRVHRDCTWQF